jgi:general secretion pathway protein G
MKASIRAFTLIELLVVLAIVALLSSIALPRYLGSLEKAKETALSENLRVLRISLDRFRADKGRWPTKLEELVEQRYVAHIPTDPMTELATTWVIVPAQGPEEEGVADVKSGSVGATRDGRPYASL